MVRDTLNVATIPATVDGTHAKHNAAVISEAAPAMEAGLAHQAGNGSGHNVKIPYAESCFSPRRRRVRVEVRLHELGDERQR